MKELVCCVDMGTSRIKAALIDAEGGLRSVSHAPAGSARRAAREAAFDAESYFRRTCRAVRRAVAGSGLSASRIRAVVLSNQRATVVPVGRDGLPVCPALGWQDTRGGRALERFIRRFGGARFIRITGLPPSTLWSLAKILWLRQEQPGVFRRAERFLLLHDYALHRFGAPGFVTDFSNASVTGLLNIRGRCWDPDVLEAAGLSEARLPALAQAGDIAGRLSRDVARATGLRWGTPLLVGGGDQQCAALGIGALDPGQTGLCLGTAAVVSCPTNRPVTDPRGRFFCTVHVVPDRWVLEGIQNTYGAAVRWTRMRGRFGSGEKLRRIAEGGSPGASGALFFPFLAGIGSPDFDPDVRGAFVGLSLFHDRHDLARSVLEGIGLEMRRILDSMQGHLRGGRLIVAGGEITRRQGLEILADMTGCELRLSRTPDATLLGAALLAWTGLGRFRSLREAARRAVRETGPRVPVTLARRHRDALYQRYCRWVKVIRDMTARGG